MRTNKLLEDLQDVDMEIIIFFLGAFCSWLITHIYYRRSFKIAPDWAVPMLDRFPEQPTREELENFIKESTLGNHLHEEGINANGSYTKYTNGEQVCKGVVKSSDIDCWGKARVDFPASFVNEPAVELSGAVSRVLSKHATRNGLEISLSTTDEESPSSLQYQARGPWR